MRTSLFILWFLATAFSGLAQELGHSPSHLEKLPSVQPPTVPSGEKQGGDTVNDAFPVGALPFTITGTTTGYNNDYDWECPYDAMAPDVVYSVTPAGDIRINVDLCGSSYDTKVFMFDADLVVIACNDDYYFDDECGVYVSRIDDVWLTDGETYFIVIDGYGWDSGEYLMNVTEFVPCSVTCPADAVPEGEPALHDGYVDDFNSGCNGWEHGSPFQEINWVNIEDGHPGSGRAWMCAKSGWFLTSHGTESRDTDWFRVFAREDGLMEFTVESEYPCYIFKLAPLDCETVGVEFQGEADCELPATLSFPVTAGEEIWLWVGPTVFSGPVTEFTYFMTVTNNQFDVVPTEDMSWGGVKALYR